MPGDCKIDFGQPIGRRKQRKLSLSCREVVGGLCIAVGLVLTISSPALAQQLGVQKPEPKPRSLGPVAVAPAVPIEITARPISSFGRAGGVGNAGGRLTFIGGLVLASPNKDFGGWSGLIVSDDGRRLLTVSDRGHWLTADLIYEAGRPMGVVNAKLGEIAGVGGQTLGRFRDRDTESLTLVDGTLAKGTVLVAFERNHRIGRFPVSERGLGAPLGYLKMPPDVRRISTNKGFESVAVLRGGPLKGAVIAFAEEYFDPARNHSGWIWPAGVGSDPQRLGLVNIADFAITDAASLPDGSLLVLERKFRWTEGVKARIRLIRATDIKPGALLDGEVLLDADMTAEIDNMEALALSRNARGQTVLTLMSDDNFNSFLQRSLLLQFTLADVPTTTKAKP
jgi:hypothetical protein